MRRLAVLPVLVILVAALATRGLLAQSKPSPSPSARTMLPLCRTGCGGGGTGPSEVMVSPYNGQDNITVSNPPANATVTFWVSNIGAQYTDTYTLTMSCPKGRESCVSQSRTSVTLAPDAVASVTVTFTPGAAGTTGTVSLTADDGNGWSDQGWYNVVSVSSAAGPQPIVSLASYNASILDYARCANACFAATYAQGTVPYFSLGSPRSVVLAYNGDQASPKPFLRADVTHGGNSGNLPTYFYLKAKGPTGAWITFLNGETELHFFTATAGAAYRMGGQFWADANGMAGTGSYPVALIVGAQYGGGRVEDTISTRVIVVRETNSVVARGWTLAGIQRGAVQSDGILIEEGDGSATWFAKSGSTYTTPIGDFSTLAASGSNYIRAYPDSTKVTFNSSGLMTQVADQWGNTTTFSYDGSGRVTLITDPMGKADTLIYGGYGLGVIADPAGRRTTIWVNSNHSLSSIQDPDGVGTSFSYDGSLRLSSVTDRRGVTISELRYHNLSDRVDSVMGPTVATYTAGNARPTTTFTPWQLLGTPYAATSSTPDTAPRADTVRATVTDPEGHAARYTVDVFGQPAIGHGPLGDTVAVVRTSSAGLAGLPDSIIPSWGSREGHHYNGSGLDTLVKAEGLATHLMYRHGFGVADTVWGDAIPVQRSGVGAHGGVSSFSIANRLPTLISHDSRGRISQTVDPELHEHDYLFDAATGNIGRDSIPNSAFSSEVTGAAVHVFGYDAFGRRTSDSLVGGPKRTMVYDTLNRLIQVFDGVNSQATTSYYDALVLRATKDVGGNLDSVIYNAAGWLVAQRDAAGNRDSIVYDRDGMVRQTINRRGQTITLTYDASHRLRARHGSQVVADTVIYAGDSVVTDSNSAAAETRFLNRRGQPDSVRTTLTGPGRTYVQHFAYRSNGLLDSTWVTGPMQSLLTRQYRYDAALTLDSIRLGSHGWTWMNLNNDGMVDTTHLPGGDKIWAGGVDQFHESNGMWSSLINDTYAVDSTTGLLTEALSVDPYYLYSWRQATTYSYDALHRLVGTTFCSWVSGGSCPPGGDSSHTFTLDPLGNRTDRGTYGAGSRILTWDGNSIGTDADGNVNCCDWSADGRLTQAGWYFFNYDPAGRLVRIDSSGTTLSNFLWQGDNLLAEFAADGTTRRGEYSYYPGLDRPHAWRGVSAPYDTVPLYAHQDGLGNVRGLSWGSLNSTNRTYLYSEWGVLEGAWPGTSGAATYDRARWKGALYVPEVGLYYVRARWYDPNTGRFLSEDPAGAGPNPYVFVGANPVSGSDPSGKCPVTIPLSQLPLIGKLLPDVTVDIDGPWCSKGESMEQGDSDEETANFLRAQGFGAAERSCSGQATNLDCVPDAFPFVPTIRAAFKPAIYEPGLVKAGALAGCGVATADLWLSLDAGVHVGAAVRDATQVIREATSGLGVAIAYEQGVRRVAREMRPSPWDAVSFGVDAARGHVSLTGIVRGQTPVLAQIDAIKEQARACTAAGEALAKK